MGSGPAGTIGPWPRTPGIATLTNVPLHAAIDLAALRTEAPMAAPRRRSVPRSLPRVAIAAGLIAAILALAVGATGVLAATTVTPKCDVVNLRTGPSTTYAKKTSVNEGAKLTVVATVGGGSYATTCGTAVSGSSWYRISAINGQSVQSLYGVTYVYGASKLFKTVVTPTPGPTASPSAAPSTPSPTAGPSAAPSVAPSTAPTADPSTDPSATPDPGSPAPTTTPGPTVGPTPTPTPQPIVLPGSITFHGRGYGHGV